MDSALGAQAKNPPAGCHLLQEKVHLDTRHPKEHRTPEPSNLGMCS
jgi:hypothetical protein